MEPITKVERPSLKQSLTPLTQERLNAVWKQMTEALHLEELLGKREVVVHDEKHFSIIATNSYFEVEFKPHQVEVLEYLRKELDNTAINCNIVVKAQVLESRAYNPREKYEAMLKRNPQLEGLHKLFPEIDY